MLYLVINTLEDFKDTNILHINLCLVMEYPDKIDYTPIPL